MHVNENISKNASMSQIAHLVDFDPNVDFLSVHNPFQSSEAGMRVLELEENL